MKNNPDMNKIFIGGCFIGIVCNDKSLPFVLKIMNKRYPNQEISYNKYEEVNLDYSSTILDLNEVDDLCELDFGDDDYSFDNYGEIPDASEFEDEKEIA